MKNISLYKPNASDMWFRAQCMSDPDTMSYNAGYDLTFDGYHYDTGCIDFDKSKWEEWVNAKYSDPDSFYAYIVDEDTHEFVGYVNYHKSSNRYEMGIVIYSKYRGMGYMKPSMELFIQYAKEHGVTALYDTIPKNREKALKVFFDLGFKVTKEFMTTKFKKDDPLYEIKLDL